MDRPVFEVTIASQAGASAKILTWGAVVRDLVVPASNGLQRVVLGLNTLDDYLNYSPSFGAVPGRFANRIANGRFVLDGVAYQLERKPGQKHTLHGGPHGFGHRIWKLGAYDSSSVELILELPDGDAGFPGALTATCVYRLLEPATLSVELSAVSDRPTIVNLTQHSYFNLDGSPDILDHELTLFADFYTPADDELDPDGRDPRRRRHALRLSHPPHGPQSELDALRHEFRRRARARRGRRSCANCGAAFAEERADDEPVLDRTRRAVLFAAPLNCPAPGLDGQHYGAHAGLALEPQVFPTRRTAAISPIACCGRTRSTST